MDTQRDGFKEWSVGMEGYRLFKKDCKGRQRESVALYVNDQLEIMKLHPGVDEADRVNGSGLKAGKGQVTL